MPTKKANGEGSIHKRENGTWRGQIIIGYKEDGTVKRKSFTGKTKKEVIEKIEEYRALNNKGLLATDDVITLSQWFHTWLFTYRIHDLKPSSFERYEGLYQNYILNSSIADIKLKDLKTVHIQNYYNSLVLEKDKTSSTVKTINKCLKSVLSQALKEGYILNNYCKYINLPKQNESNITNDYIRSFTLDEQKKFMSISLNDKKGVLYLFALGTGLRLGEILALKWTDINLKSNIVSVTKTIKETYTFDKNEKRHYAILEQSPKTTSSIRDVPLNEKLIDLLMDYRKKQKLKL
jgi:integrase